MKLVKYVQTDCMPCKQVGLFLQHLGVEVDETINLDSPEEKEKVAGLNIMSTPTIVLFDDNGEELSRASGMNPPAINGLFVQAGRI